MLLWMPSVISDGTISITCSCNVANFAQLYLFFESFSANRTLTSLLKNRRNYSILV